MLAFTQFSLSLWIPLASLEGKRHGDLLDPNLWDDDPPTGPQGPRFIRAEVHVPSRTSGWAGLDGGPLVFSQP